MTFVRAGRVKGSAGHEEKHHFTTAWNLFWALFLESGELLPHCGRSFYFIYSQSNTVWAEDLCLDVLPVWRSLHKMEESQDQFLGMKQLGEKVLAGLRVKRVERVSKDRLTVTMHRTGQLPPRMLPAQRNC